MIGQILAQMSFVDVFNICVFLIFTLCYFYQIVYVFVSLTRKPPSRDAKANRRATVKAIWLFMTSTCASGQRVRIASSSAA